MKKNFKKTGTSLSDKLKSAITDISVDIFGYEKSVTSNIINNTSYIANKIDIPKQRLSIRIFHRNHVIKAVLYDQATPIQAIALNELAYFFVERATADLSSIQNKIGLSIKEYLREFAKEHHIAEESVSIWINVKDENVHIRAFSNSVFIKEITVSTLIKFFR